MPGALSTPPTARTPSRSLSTTARETELLERLANAFATANALLSQRAVSSFASEPWRWVADV
jgi:hypothetical protein